MKKMFKNLLIILLAVIVVAMIPISIFIIKPEYSLVNNRKNLEVLNANELAGGGDYIHFLNTGSSDAILIESDGKFALIDAGEDNDNPRGFKSLELTGYEDEVVSYLKKNASDQNGKVKLDFILGTHSHSDHLGGFDTVISDDDIEIGRAYLKEYDSSKINDKENEKWDNQEVYDQTVNALKAKNVTIISNPDGNPFKLGNFTVTLFNVEDNISEEKLGENDQSFGVLIEKNGTRVFLSGDIDNLSGDEDRLAPEIGDIDLLKVGHHGYYGSTSSKWIKTLSPEYCVITNKKNGPAKPILWRIERIADSTILTTGAENGIIAEIGNNGNIKFYNCGMER
ncbi:MAG: MBL fold metallo-hydrolase [Clostridia bacterium]|nr:MBL fold metallo-hydrolase [Clostridia bacterium]